MKTEVHIVERNGVGLSVEAFREWVNRIKPIDIAITVKLSSDERFKFDYFCKQLDKDPEETLSQIVEGALQERLRFLE